MPDDDLPHNKRGRKEIAKSPDNYSTHTDIVISILKGVSSKLDTLTASVDKTNKTMNEIDEKLNAKMDKLESTVTDNINRLTVEVDTRIQNFTTDMNKRFESLWNATQASCQDIASSNELTSSKIDQCQSVNETRLNRLERENLRNELIITGVPVVVGERVLDIFGDICLALDTNLNSGDVVSVYRIPLTRDSNAKKSKGRSAISTSPIIVKLVSDWAKQNLLAAYFKRKNLNTGDIGFTAKARIYINESLTKCNREIFNSAAEAKNSKVIFKYFTRNGLVHIQIKEQGKVIRINDMDQLKAAIASNTSSSSPKTKSAALQKQTSISLTSTSTSQTTTAIPQVPNTKPQTSISALQPSASTLSITNNPRNSTTTIDTSNTITDSSATSTDTPALAVHNGELIDQEQ